METYLQAAADMGSARTFGQQGCGIPRRWDVRAQRAFFEKGLRAQRVFLKNKGFFAHNALRFFAKDIPRAQRVF